MLSPKGYVLASLAISSVSFLLFLISKHGPFLGLSFLGLVAAWGWYSELD